MGVISPNLAQLREQKQRLVETLKLVSLAPDLVLVQMDLFPNKPTMVIMTMDHCCVNQHKNDSFPGNNNEDDHQPPPKDSTFFDSSKYKDGPNSFLG